MTSPLAKAAARALAARSVVPPVSDGSDRARGIAAIQRAMVERAARRRRITLGFSVGGIAVAAAAALAVMKLHGSPTPVALASKAPTLATDRVTLTTTTVEPGVTLNDGHGARSLALDVPVVAGDRVVAPRGAHAMLGFSTGTSLTVDGADVTVLDASTLERFDLRDGALAAKVAHLAPGRRFVIQTPDAEVEVRGTTFRVTVLPPQEACSDGNRTRVVVTDGVVVVRAHGHEDRVAAGASWPASCAPVAASAGGASVAHPVASNTTAAALSASTLSAQNDLFADAMTAKRSGDKVRAVATLDELLAKYPGGPLSESAEAERLRLLREVDPARAGNEARAYLRRYPKGFARDEAQAILTP